MSQFVFVLIAFAGASFFLFKRREFDYYSVGFFGSLIYFSPGFVGYTSYADHGVWYDKAINHEAYAVMYLVLISIVFSARFSLKAAVKTASSFKTQGLSKLPHAMFFVSILGLIALIFVIGDMINDPDKTAYMDKLGRWHILFYTAATLGLPISVLYKKNLFSVLFFCLLLFDLYIGFRSSIAIACLSVLVLQLSVRGPQNLLKDNFRLIFMAVALVLFLLGYKVVAFAVKAGMWDLVFFELQNPSTYKAMLLRSEPFVTQHILNEVVASNFRTDLSGIYAVVFQLILFSDKIGVNVVSFNDLFQPILFPSVEYGMASNIWAQMWSAGGWPLLFIFVIFYNFILWLGGMALRSENLFLRVGSAPMFCFFTLYIHRNDFGYAINIEKRLALVLLAAFVFANVIKFMFLKTRNFKD